MLAHLQSNKVVLVFGLGKGRRLGEVRLVDEIYGRFLEGFVDFWKGNDGDPGVLLVLGEGVVGEDAVGELVEDFYY